MWRGNEYDDQKRENRELIKTGQEPKSLIDVLSIVEHPKFEEFYEQLRKEGYEFAEATPTDTEKPSTGNGKASGRRNWECQGRKGKLPPRALG